MIKHADCVGEKTKLEREALTEPRVRGVGIQSVWSWSNVRRSDVTQ